jgi:hypothetical protein
MPSKGKLKRQAEGVAMKVLGHIPVVEEGLGLVNDSDEGDYNIKYEKCKFQEEAITFPAFSINVFQKEVLLFQFYMIIKAEGSLKGWGFYELDLPEERLPLVRDFLDRMNACGELHYEYDGKKLHCTKIVAASTPDVVAQFCHYFILNLIVILPAVLGGDEAKLDKIASANLTNEIAFELKRGRSNILDVVKKAGAMLPSALVKEMPMKMIDGKVRNGVAITVPVAFKSGRPEDEMVVLIIEGLKPQELILQHLAMDSSRRDTIRWNLPFNVRDLVRKFLKRYSSLTSDVEGTLLPDGTLNITGSFSCKDKTAEDLKRFILVFLQCVIHIEVRVREASGGNLKPLQDFLEEPTMN